MLPHELFYASAVHATSKRGTCFDCPAVSQSVIKKFIAKPEHHFASFGTPDTLVFSHQTWCDKSGLTPSSSTGCSVYRWNMKRWCTIFVVLYLTLTISGCAYAESRENCDSLFIFLRFSFNSFNFCQLSHSAQHTKLDFRRMLIVHYAFRTVSYVAYRTSVSCLNELLKLFP